VVGIVIVLAGKTGGKQLSTPRKNGAVSWSGRVTDTDHAGKQEGTAAKGISVLLIPGLWPLSLRFDLQLIQFEKFLNDGLRGLLHVAVRSEKNRLAFMQEDDSIRQLLGQSHVVGHDDAGQV
jgi:hypothetical protein